MTLGGEEESRDIAEGKGGMLRMIAGSIKTLRTVGHAAGRRGRGLAIERHAMRCYRGAIVGVRSRAGVPACCWQLATHGRKQVSESGSSSSPTNSSAGSNGAAQ